MARNGLKTRKTRKIFTTEMVPDLLTVELEQIKQKLINETQKNKNKKKGKKTDYLKPKEMSDTQTTRRSSKLKAERQKAPSWSTRP